MQFTQGKKDTNVTRVGRLIDDMDEFSAFRAQYSRRRTNNSQRAPQTRRPQTAPVVAYRFTVLIDDRDEVE